MLFDVVDGALDFMKKGPRALARALEFSSEVNADEGEALDTKTLLQYLTKVMPGDDIAGLIRRALAQWDNEASGGWTRDTQRNSYDRRSLIYSLLELSEDWIKLCDTLFPFHPLEEPVVIATEHSPWYSDEVRRARDFYWRAYTKQLSIQGWPEESIRQLDLSTGSIVERLADPSAPAAYQAKGLVVGYVQSGKTANFSGVIARAADAGYKLIIVLAGTLDVLRSQTQRRIDKEMIGQELLQRDYVNDADWDEFLKHGGRPSDLGSFDWYRLTGPESDYKKLARGVEALKFESSNGAKPLWDRENLFRASTRIAVVKKHSVVVQRLLSDLKALSRGRIGAPLDQVPALIIDDESDQASINVNKNAAAGITQERTATNAAIVGLLTLLPRAQYVGYTATPFANVFVDPNNEEDIFPKDFLISLPRPDGYMGVSDFYDLDGSEEDDESRPNERDFVRPVSGDDTDPENLERAIDSFVLSGALKLFRANADPGLKFRHHTMLTHISQKVVDHKALAELVRSTFAKAAYEGGVGLDRLEKLFETDFKRVYAERGEGRPFPSKFSMLGPFLGECLSKIGDARDAVLVLNNETKEQTPDFDKQSVWKILVGGTKLSRGYTVEGLTVSYYRRRAGAADTLMQMGRWFGFRRGYRDLVRLYIGTKEQVGSSQNNTVNLYKSFGAICRDEEMFREELKRYSNLAERITPKDIPPLVPSHMLRPTSANKMYNAVVTYRNFGGALSESTLAPTEKVDVVHNNDALKTMIGSGVAAREELRAKIRSKEKKLIANTVLLTPSSVIAFLKSYRWYDANDRASRNGNPLHLQIEFLEGKGGSPEIDDWLLVGPEIDKPPATLPLAGANFHVVYRSRHEEASGRFHTYNDPYHRAFAEFIVNKSVDLKDPNQALRNLKVPRRAAMILYPVTDQKAPKAVKAPFNIGFTLLFPQNAIRSPITFSVRQQAFKDAAVVTVT